ncbi:hypothetical protein BJX61DRAFT_226891 [Aspergillus egyptiacus]|nr:hypothetical protein BJX61DRAFT_226891 [Aspergillus egyptiacus]
MLEVYQNCVMNWTSVLRNSRPFKVMDDKAFSSDSNNLMTNRDPNTPQGPHSGPVPTSDKETGSKRTGIEAADNAMIYTEDDWLGMQQSVRRKHVTCDRAETRTNKISTFKSGSLSSRPSSPLLTHYFYHRPDLNSCLPKQPTYHLLLYQSK